MEENKGKKSPNTVLVSAGVFFFAGIVTGAAGYLYGKPITEIVRNVIMVLIGTGTVLYMLSYADGTHGFNYDNKEHMGRFYILFVFILIVAEALPLLPAAGWPYLVIFVALSLFSNELIGLMSGTVFLMITVLSGNAVSVGEFFIHFVSGFVGIILFRELNELFKVGAKVFLSLLVLFLCLSANYILFVNEVFSIQLFLIPVINVFASFLLLMIVLKYFSFQIVHKYREIFLDLNDPECPLLVSLREKDEDEYFHAMHTAYLCDRIAKKLGIDDTVTKAGGYYHHIGRLNGENSWEKIEEIAKEYHFPPNLMDLLKEYNSRDRKLVSKESVVLFFSDSIIMAIRGLLKKDPNTILDYYLIIDTVFKKRIGSGAIDESIISLEEMNRMKKLYLEEKLYYDFLR